MEEEEDVSFVPGSMIRSARDAVVDSDYVETDLDVRDDESDIGDEDDGCFVYRRACEQLKVVPVTHVLESVLSVCGHVVELDLSNHGLGPKGGCAIAEGHVLRHGHQR